MQKKWKLVLGCIIAIIGLGIFIWESARPIRAELLEVQPGPIAKTFEEEGKVVADVERPVYCVNGGKIVDLPVKEGQEVKQGDLLAVIESKELKLEIDRLQAQLKSSQAEKAKEFAEPYRLEVQRRQLQVENARQEFKSAQTNFKRMEQLFEAGAISSSEFEDAKKLFNIANNNLQQQKVAQSLLTTTHEAGSGLDRYYEGMQEALQAQIELIKYKIDNNRIEASIDGVVSELSVEKGEMVNPQAPLMKVFQRAPYLVEVFVLTEDISGIKTGMSVDLVHEYNDEDVKFKGTVVGIAPSAVEKISVLGLEEQRVKVKIEPQTPEAVKLRPGYVLDVEFTTGEQENRLVVPKTALFPYEEGDALWVVRNGKAEIQPVKKGFENKRDVVIKKGLNNGDLIVLNPQAKEIEEGSRVVKDHPSR